ncbi:hypothetical protein [Streptomyces microflavus]|uniref:hypothetical protein n=1 Tax=Streptomyces microflavus TaxID=1919 RepID=UPI0033E8914C
MTDKIGCVTMSLNDMGDTWELRCNRCAWGSHLMQDEQYAGCWGVENYQLVESWAQDHSSRHID